MSKPNVVLGLLGTTLDKGQSGKRWQRWRPTVDLVRHDPLPVDRLELMFGPGSDRLAEFIAADVLSVSPHTLVRTHELSIRDWWDFEDVYGALFDFVRDYAFDQDRERYLVHITTGSHVAQICWFLLAEARIVPAELLQTSPPREKDRSQPGGFSTIDLDLSRYDHIARRFSERHREGVSVLKSGIETRNLAFNELIAELERVALASSAPILLLGPTGAGKSALARRVYELRRARRNVTGPFVEVNCATLRGDSAMSALFGHKMGAFTGAVAERPGLLRAAHGGMLFLDEIGELGLDEQAMLLRALEEKRFLPVGADKEVESDFVLIAGTNRNLQLRVAEGRFRDDLLARIDVWTFLLPGLRDRPEDIAPNLEYELDRIQQRTGERVSFNREARERFEQFAESAPWPRNFRDFGAALSRMATLAPGSRIDLETVEREIKRLGAAWAIPSTSAPTAPPGLPESVSRPATHPATAPHHLLERIGERLGPLDRFEIIQLAEVLRTCAGSASLSEAGRKLFGESRKKKEKPNDADRLRKYLTRLGLDFQEAQELGTPN